MAENGFRMLMDITNRNSLRHHYRQQRRNLSQQQQQQASEKLLAQCVTHPDFNKAEHLAFYLANDGEVDPHPVINYCWQQQKAVYLPVLHPFTVGHLLFIRYTSNSPMGVNRYGIAEPKIRCPDVLPLQKLDLIFTPLVAFDASGNRLGMGGGFYDRTLAPVQRDGLNTKVIGLAHQCQQAQSLPVEPWDIPLKQIIAV